MERQRGITVAIVVTLVLAIVSLGVAFAAFSTTLNINGTATVQASSWSVFFVAASDATTKPSSATNIASSDITPGNYAGFASTATAGTTNTVAETTVTWNAKFKTPGDTLKYTLYIRNGGTYNAKIAATSGIVTPTPTCVSGETTVCGHIHYKLYTSAPTGDPSTTGTALTSNFTINAGSTQTIYLVAWLDKDLAQGDLPSSNVVTNTIQTTLKFEQTN